jgi:tRNA(fMet)-specific endonuclease VapC
MRIVIDTTAYIGYIKDHPGIVEKFRQASEIFVPAIVVGELHYGHNKGTQFKDNQQRLNKFLSNERVNYIAVDNEVAAVYGKLKAQQEAMGKSLGENDLWIAAVCFYLQLPLLTTDTDFARIEELELVELD